MRRLWATGKPPPRRYFFLPRARLAYPAFENFVLNFSIRPAVSTNFNLPVKNGWQALQMSTFSSLRVLRVVKVLPHPQWTLVS